VRHLRRTYVKLLKSVEYIKSRKNSIIYIGFQETYEQDFNNIKKILNLPNMQININIPKAHIAPTNSNKYLSEKAIENLKKWYAKDIKIYEYCLAHKEEFNINTNL